LFFHALIKWFAFISCLSSEELGHLVEVSVRFPVIPRMHFLRVSNHLLEVFQPKVLFIHFCPLTIRRIFFLLMYFCQTSFLYRFFFFLGGIFLSNKLLLWRWVNHINIIRVSLLKFLKDSLCYIGKWLHSLFFWCIYYT
jgi:hypothetical protein